MRLGGASASAVGARWGMSRWAVQRHMAHCSPERRRELLAGAGQILQLAELAAKDGTSLREKANILVSLLWGRVLACTEANDNQGVANLSGKLLDAMRHAGQLSGELKALGALVVNNHHTQVNIVASPTFIALSEGLLEIARSHPEARGAIVGLLERVSEMETPPANGSRFSGGPALIEAEFADAE